MITFLAIIYSKLSIVVALLIFKDNSIISELSVILLVLLNNFKFYFFIIFLTAKPSLECMFTK